MDAGAAPGYHRSAHGRPHADRLDCAPLRSRVPPHVRTGPEGSTLTGSHQDTWAEDVQLFGERREEVYEFTLGRSDYFV